MASPAYSKLPTEEPGTPVHIHTPESPVYIGSPAMGHQNVPPPNYPTIHRPPPASICTTNEGDDDEVKTININITIKIPKSFNFPCFRRPHCRRDPAYATTATRDGYRTPCAEKFRRAFAVILAIFYLSFFICGAAAWGKRNSEGINNISAGLLAATTFTPFLDFLVVASTILIARRFNEERRPGLIFGLLVLINIALFAFHLAVMIIAIYWLKNSPWWYYNTDTKTIVGLTLYSVCTMTLIKLLLVIFVSKKLATKEGTLKRHLRAFREEFRQCVEGGDSVNRQVEEGDVRRSQEGGVFLP